MAYGLSASADGNTFPWVFNPPVTYWDGASAFIKYVAEKEGGLDKLKGKKIGLIHLDAPFGKEPIPLLESLAKEYGFEVKLYPVAAQDMQNQGSVWLNIRRDRPDWIYNQGWGAMNPTAVKEAIKAGFPIDKLVGVWWAGGDDDARAGGAEAKGYKSLNFHAAGHEFPGDPGHPEARRRQGPMSTTPKEKVGENLYNRGVYNSMLIAEAIRNAQKITGKKVVNGEDVRRGLETLNITEARLKELGMEGFASPVKVACEDHNGHHKVYVAEWDGTEVDQGLRLDGSDAGQGASADRGRGEGICREQCRLAEAHRGLREVVVADSTANAPPAVRVGGCVPDADCPIGPTRQMTPLIATPRPLHLAECQPDSDPRGQQHRGDLRSRDPGAEGRVAHGAARRHRRDPRRQRRRQDDDAEGDLEPARAERGEVTKGSIEFDGERVDRLSPNELVRRGCIQVMEGRHCFGHLTIEENLLTGAFTRARRQRRHPRDIETIYDYFPRLQAAPQFAWPATPPAASSRCAPSAGR